MGNWERVVIYKIFDEQPGTWKYISVQVFDDKMRRTCYI